jgi:hypothetical protein
MPLLIHIYGNTGNQFVPIWLALGADPCKVSDYFNAHPNTALIGYLSHNKKALETRFDVYGRIEDM